MGFERQQRCRQSTRIGLVAQAGKHALVPQMHAIEVAYGQGTRRQVKTAGISQKRTHGYTKTK